MSKIRFIFVVLIQTNSSNPLKPPNPMKKVISEMKNNVNGSLSSIFTKEDVIKILETIDEQSKVEGNSVPFDEEKLEEILDDLRSILSNVEDIEVDCDDIEFSISGREIVVDDVNVRGKEEVTSDIESLIEKLEEVKESC